MTEHPRDMTIIVVSYNSAKTLARCLHSLVQYGAAPGRAIVVVDNASRDGSADIARAIPGVEVIEAGANLGFGAANNLGMRRFPARSYYLHNADAYLQAPVLGAAQRAFTQNPHLGILGLPLVYPDGSPQTGAFGFTSVRKWALQGLGVAALARWVLRGPMGRCVARIMPRHGWASSFVATETGAAQSADGSVVAVDWVCGAALLLTEQARAQTGGFDERIFLYAEDEDLCRRATAQGWQVAQLRETPVIHDFGWGQTGRASKTVARHKADSLRIFIDTHFSKGSPRWILMRAMLWIKMLRWGVWRATGKHGSPKG